MDNTLHRQALGPATTFRRFEMALTKSTYETTDRRNRPVTIKTYQREIDIAAKGEEPQPYNRHYIIAKTRYGNETHWMNLGSSCLECGYWTKTSAINMIAEGARKVTCEKCLAAMGQAPE